MKAKISEEITLTIPNDEGQFQIEVDASDFTMGGILSQHQKDNTWRPVAFLSKLFNSTEQNYEIYNKEMLAVMYGAVHLVTTTLDSGGIDGQQNFSGHH